DEHGYRATLEALARDAGVADRMHFVGAARDEHKWALYEQAMMLVLPSYSENFGNVIAEAMAMACPVILTPDVGLAALVRESGSGVVTSGEPQELARVIRELAANAEARKRMG